MAVASSNHFGPSKHELAATIVTAWEAIGETGVSVWVDADGEIRSNLVNGLPPRGEVVPFKARGGAK